MTATRPRAERRPPAAEESRSLAPTVVVALAERLLAEALARLLHAHGLHVVGAYDGEAALADKIARCRPGLALVGADLESGDDPDALLGALRAAGPDTRIVLLAGEVDGALARSALRHDVKAVLLQTSTADDAVATLLHVSHGGTSFPACFLAQLGDEGRDAVLSRRQHEVLERLALGRSNSEIARELYISPNTVKFHVRVIYERLGVKNRVEAARVLALRHPI